MEFTWKEKVSDENEVQSGCTLTKMYPRNDILALNYIRLILDEVYFSFSRLKAQLIKTGILFNTAAQG